MNILLVSPRTPDTFWSFAHIMPFISKKAAFPPLGLLTVAAMLPRSWSLKLVDLNVSRLTDDTIAWADCVMISGMIVHAESARRVIARCNALGKTVIAGGPLFTTGHARFPEVRHFVLGEAENLMPHVVADLQTGNLKRFYESPTRPDVTTTPIPRWDLLDMRRYATMPVQVSRGCPFNCEFCDIIVMYGRVPRIKTPEQTIAELEALRAAGWNGSVFIVDDNFIGNRAKIATLLREMVAWRRRRNVRMTFTTEASINLADHPELLSLMVQAGFTNVFVGIESPSESSLNECAKVQNTRRDLVAAVRRIHNAGLQVMGGFIVGFDNDTPKIFEEQRRFVRDAGVVTAMVGLLTALPGTRLHTRLHGEGRLLGLSTGNNLDAVLNFIPKLDRQVLIDGYRRLVKSLYEPREYYARILNFLRDYRPVPGRWRLARGELMAFARSLWVMGVRNKGRRAFWLFVTQAFLRHRRAFGEAMQLSIFGYHFRKVAAGL